MQCEAGKMFVEAVHSTVLLPGIMEVHSYANEEYNAKTPGCHVNNPNNFTLQTGENQKPLFSDLFRLFFSIYLSYLTEKQG